MPRFVWIQRLDCPDLRGIVEPNVGQGKVTTALYANRRAGIEAADARDVPPGGNPARAQQVCKRKIPVIAQHQVKLPEFCSQVAEAKATTGPPAELV